ncbi:MAG: ATP-dependent DNA helicase RecG [Actinomycetia bacterium]|nr:ATP-dependent DNA helicase RecG [Actinomycetes bacterium]
MADEKAIELAELDAIAIGRLNGVGPKKEKGLTHFEIHTVLDLLTHYPRRYIDRSNQVPIAELAPGEEAMVVVTIDSMSTRPTRNRRVKMTTGRVHDHSGTLAITFFNQPWRQKQLGPGVEAVLFGKVDLYRGKRQMSNPVVDLVGDQTGRIVPVYPQSEKAGLTTREIGEWVAESLRRVDNGRGFAEPLPEAVLDRFDFVNRSAAYHGIHAPDSMAEIQVARRRLVFDELLRIQLALVLRKRAIERDSRGVEHQLDGELTRAFHDRLPFPLTGAQARVIGEIEADLAKPVPMHRLLQGDVGSGKTVVAVSSMLDAVQGGHQGALMAPTEVLAEQHHLGVSELLDGFTVPDSATLMGERPLKVDLLTNRVSTPDRRRILAELVAGGVDIVIGTHALIQEAVSFHSLGVVVIDEQHRFGVEQRAALREKNVDGTVPDVLVMTATPIPRTAAMTVYGDLDVSVLDEMPPGRTPIRTEWVRTGWGSGEGQDEGLDASRVWQHVRDEVVADRQAYVVCPLIEESEKLEVASAEEVFERLRADELEGLSLGLLHGRVTPVEKEETMRQFREGRLSVLVATTVIEVGVDVPNATIMVIVDADRFGIAQLHQLRGRVGRGADESSCYLLASAETPEGQARLEAIEATTDGFELAEIDLELRGEGTIMGERQKGRNDLKLASLRRDKQWVASAREVAVDLVAADPTLERHELLANEIGLFLGEADTAFLLKG